MMSYCGRELTLRDALSDPVIRAVMEADRVDPDELEADLNEIARTLRHRVTPQVSCCDMALHA
jgi:hypothetical protein